VAYEKGETYQIFVDTLAYISALVVVKEFNRRKNDNCLQCLFPNVLKLGNCFNNCHSVTFCIIIVLIRNWREDETFKT
jgi:hypothetical protein